MTQGSYEPEGGTDRGDRDEDAGDPKGDQSLQANSRTGSDPTLPFSITITVNGVKITIESDGSCPPGVAVKRG